MRARAADCGVYDLIFDIIKFIAITHAVYCVTIPIARQLAFSATNAAACTVLCNRQRRIDEAEVESIVKSATVERECRSTINQGDSFSGSRAITDHFPDADAGEFARVRGPSTL